MLNREEKPHYNIMLSGEDKEERIKNLKILIAEDDETSDLFITRLLKKIIQRVLHAKTGVETVEACRNNPDLDLVLMDIQMPGMNGYEATRQIRQFNTDCGYYCTNSLCTLQVTGKRQ